MAVQFDGVSYIDWAGWPVPSGATGTVTVCCWIMPTNIGGTQRLWGSETHMEVRLNGAGALLNDIFEGVPPSTTFNLVNNTVYHVAVTGDANTNTAQTYINGVLDVQYFAATGGTVGTTLRIGNRTGAPVGNSYEGLMEDWRSYNRVLTPAEITTIYATRGVDGIVDGCTARVLFNENAPGLTTSAPVDLSNTGMTVNSLTGTPIYAPSLGLKLRRAA